jgi:hypothetical protein
LIRAPPLPGGPIGRLAILLVRPVQAALDRPVFDILVWPTSMLGNGPPVMV